MEASRIPRGNRIVMGAALGAAAALLVLRLLVPPIIGLADNGDFARLSAPAGLVWAGENAEDTHYRWMQPRYLFVARMPDPGGYRSSEMLLLDPAVRVSRGILRASVFDIRLLAVVHMLLLLAGVAAIVRACREISLPAQVLAAALLVFFFTDPGYVAPFNSLYSQTASFSFLILTVAAAALGVRRGGLSGSLLAAFFLFAALFVCSKPQESVQAPLLALFGLRLAWGGGRRWKWMALAVSVALCALAWRYYSSSDNSQGWITRYNMVFREILLHSPHPERDLAELGLDPSWAKDAGANGWSAQSPARDPAVWNYLKGRSGTSPRLFYLRHPRRFFELLARSAKVSYELVPRDLGNYAKESGAAPLAQAKAPWSRLRSALSGLPWLIVFFGGTLAAAAATYRRASRRRRFFREGLALLVVMAAGAFVVSALGDSQLEIIRHLYTFHALCDLILVADAAWIAQSLTQRVRPHAST